MKDKICYVFTSLLKLPVDVILHESVFSVGVLRGADLQRQISCTYTPVLILSTKTMTMTNKLITVLMQSLIQ